MEAVKELHEGSKLKEEKERVMIKETKRRKFTHAKDFF